MHETIERETGVDLGDAKVFLDWTVLLTFVVIDQKIRPPAAETRGNVLEVST